MNSKNYFDEFIAAEKFSAEVRRRLEKEDSQGQLF